MNKEDIGIDLDTFSIEKEIAKFDDMKVDGWDIVIRLYMEPAVTKGGILLTPKTQEEGEYTNCVGLVVKKSSAAYLDNRYEQTGSWCEVGEWRTFPRHAGWKMKYKGMPVFVLKEDAVGPKVPDPRYVTR